jgi:hypothetical protein
MGEINAAFELLKERLPALGSSGRGGGEKLTKINVLHMAINYIRAMEAMLEAGREDVARLDLEHLMRNPFSSQERSSSSSSLASTNALQTEASASTNSNDHSQGSSMLHDAATEEEDEEEEEGVECPDWTELTASLGPLQPMAASQPEPLASSSCSYSHFISSSFFRASASAFSHAQSFLSWPVTLTSRPEAEPAAFNGY